MLRKLRRQYWLVLFAALLAGQAHAQQDRRRFSVIEALSGKPVTALAEDRDGLIWAGGPAGLLRFDGLRAERRPIDGRDSAIRALAADGEDLWIAHERGIARWNAIDDQMQPLDCPLAADGARQVLSLPEAVYLLAGPRVLAIDRATLACRALSFGELPPEATVEVFWRHQDGWWLGLRDRGLWNCTDPCTAMSPFAPDLADSRVRWISDSDDGGLWVGTHRHGLYRLAADGNVLDRWLRDAADPSRALATMGIIAVEAEPDGRVWVGHWAGGLTELGTDGAIRSRSRLIPHEPTALAGDIVTALLRTRNGSVYIGHENGVSLFDPVRNRTLWLGPASENRTGLARPDVRSIYSTDGQILWVGSNRGGLNRVDLRNNTIIVLRHDPARSDTLPSDTIWDIKPAADGRLWLATSGGLARLAPDTLRVERLLHWPELPSDDVYELASAQDGGVWLAVWAGGLVKANADGRLMRVWRSQDGLDSETLIAVHEDRQGRLFAASEGGVFALQADGRFAALAWPNGPVSVGEQRVERIIDGKGGGVWFGSVGAGLAWLGPEDRHLRAGPLDARLQASMLARGPQDRLWLATQSELWELSDAGQVVRRLSVPSAEFDLAGARALWVDPAGTVYLAGRNGVLGVDTRQQTVRTLPVSPVITGVRLFNAPLAVHPDGRLRSAASNGGPLLLDYADDLLTLDFALPELPRPAGLRYRYRLSGFDPRWVEVAEAEPRAVYTRLPPGQYEFEVQAGDASGWFDAQARLPIHVAPPWWMTWWARSLGMALLLAGLAAGLSMRTWQLRAQAARLEQRVAERTAELERANRALDLAARTDPLTGLYNRRGLLAEVEPEWTALADRAALMLIDIDHFKGINDRYGHDAGDAVLIEVARRLRIGLAPVDRLARWGGEEFLCVLVSETADLSDLAARAERIRASVGGNAMPEGAGPARVTLSAGLASVASGEVIDDVLRRADALLYEGKRGGRDRLVSSLRAPSSSANRPAS